MGPVVDYHSICMLSISLMYGIDGVTHFGSDSSDINIVSHKLQEFMVSSVA